jgi:bifunctional DNA-binding transcriptional regulator/antitoxin component of YhaV-PrlF toxin-antitoxin module
MNTNSRYEIITQLDPDTGDVIIPIPQELLDSLGWKEGDQVEFTKTETGGYVISKNQS